MSTPAQKPGLSQRIRDSYVNFMSRLGTITDKSTHGEFTLTVLDRLQLEMAYRGDWVARKIVNIPAGDATREWRTWKADPDVVEKIENEEKRLGIQHKTNAALLRARLYGGAALVLGTRNGLPQEPLDVETAAIHGLKYVHVLSKHELIAGEPDRDIQSPTFGLPLTYQINSPNTGPVTIHASRVIRFVGQELPSRDISGTDGWGDSILQAVHDAVMNVASSSAGVAAMIQEAKVDVIRVPNLMAGMGDEDYKSRLFDRFTVANQMKSVTSALLLDKEDEWERITMDFTHLAEIVKLYLLIASGAADIPATRLIGQSAQGLNATGEGDLINYYDSIGSFQENVLTPAMDPLDRIILASAVKSPDPGIWYEWSPLWQLSDEKRAIVNKTKADTFKVDVDAGIIDPAILSKARVSQLIEDGTYPGLEDAIEEFEREGGGVDEDDPEAADQFDKQKKMKEADGTIVSDATPRTLYVRRDVLNAAEIAAHYRRQGVQGLMDSSKWHVTIAYSKVPVDWIKVGSDHFGAADDGTVLIPPGGARLHERLGEGDAVVLQFTSSFLSYRHREICEAGASWDWPDYQPHVTISWDADRSIEVRDLEPWRGALKLGPEIFEEIDENWRSKT